MITFDIKKTTPELLLQAINHISKNQKCWIVGGFLRDIYWGRNVDIYFSRNRLNVAISRSQCLSIVIMNKKILEINCKKVEHIRLVNTFMKLLNYEKTK